MNNWDADHSAEQVQDIESFLHFLEVLIKDWEAATKAEKTSPSSPYRSMYGWENTNIGDFFEAAIAGARGNKLGQPGGAYADKSAWRQAAQIMLLGKVYE